MRAYDFGVEFPDQGLKDAVEGFIRVFAQVIVDSVDEVDQKVIGVVLLVPFELDSNKITGVRL